jgi:uncharacterized protein (DUF2236 family)
VRTIHHWLTATDPDGTRYRLDEPDLLLWVHCAMRAVHRAESADQFR